MYALVWFGVSREPTVSELISYMMACFVVDLYCFREISNWVNAGQSLELHFNLIDSDRPGAY